MRDFILFDAYPVLTRGYRDLRLLAISTHITELSYTISDIQTRIFGARVSQQSSQDGTLTGWLTEIQELRHQSQSAQEASGASGASNVIDKSLSNLDERLDDISKGIKTVNESMEPLLVANSKTPTQASLDTGDADGETGLLRKHSALLADWESVQKESEMLREELREDKWLTVFRTVTEQADGMMASLEKAVNRCQVRRAAWPIVDRVPVLNVPQDFIRSLDPGHDALSRSSSSSSVRSDKSIPSLEKFNSLSDTFEAKKKFVMCSSPS